MAETIGIAILSSVAPELIGTSVLGVGVSGLVGTTVIAGAGIGLNYALAAKPQVPTAQSGQITTRQALPPRRRYYGQVKASGPLLFSEVKDGVRYQVIALNQGEIGSYDEHWLADKVAVLDVSGFVTTDYRKGSQLFVSITPLLGTDSDAAFSLLVTKFPDIWTSAHRGRGFAKVLIETRQPKSEDFTSVYPGGQAPPYRAIMRAARVWDPRGVGQDKDNKATWGWTQNPVLIALDYHRHADGLGLAALDDILFPQSALDADWIPAANICDEAISLKAGATEPRYRCGGGYDLPNTAPKDVLAAILATCDGQVYPRPDGSIGIRVGSVVAPSITLTDKHIRGYQNFRNGQDVFLAANEITAKYTSIANDFQETDAEPWRNEDDITERGQVFTRDIGLTWVQSHSQARRLMKVAMARANPAWTGTLLTDLYGLALKNERYVHLVLDEIGIEDDFEITSWSMATDTMVCSIGVSAFDQAAYDWIPAYEEGEAPPIADHGPAPGTITAPSGLSTSVTSGAITLAWTAPTRVDAVEEAEFRPVGDPNWTDMTITGSSITTPALGSGDYALRVRFRVGDARLGVVDRKRDHLMRPARC